ncbi:DUF3606 domain-containing protein [Pedobacter sp. MR22-3]|uniref:DUF3606 domain-containing protein n=1 Tax=Pedobacter sp. MR22-3 TaxID=2994552 RepID=UPI0022467B7F|nr:DUF3606 domain-containing protein [Pedobacter sp. MR22-3]MCX2584806.1 DUF3606 domain-containing protein [Pedobacter sp. MR22-3]
MSDSKHKQDGREDSKVDLNDASEVAYAAKQAGVTSAQYKELAKASGSSSRSKIAEYIKSNAKA